MEDKIGADAGKVWAKLSKDGPQTAAALSRAVNLPTEDLNRAVGWLAREGKVGESRDPKGNAKISLR